MRLSAEALTLPFVRTFRISRASRDQARNILVRFRHGDVEGWGESAPLDYYYGQTQESALRAVASMEALLGSDPFAVEEIVRGLGEAFPTQPSARCAVDLALHDWIGKRLGIPVASLLGLATGRRIPTSFTISLGDRGSVAEAVEAARGWPLLKIKLGGDDDLGLMDQVRSVTDATLRVDANAAWTVEEAIEKCRVMSDMGLDLVEQPIAPGNPEGLRRVRESTGLPIVADEDCKTAEDLFALRGCVDGVNIKLAKTGGLREAFRMAMVARAMGLDIMLGTMAEGHVGTAASAQLIPLARWADLDGPLLLDCRGDPFGGVVYEAGEILMPEGPGLGVRPTE